MFHNSDRIKEESNKNIMSIAISDNIGYQKNPGENNPFLSFVVRIYLVDHSLRPNDHFQLARPLIEF
jgi:hypothetical protein